MELLEREPQLKLMNDALDEVSKENGRIVLLSGEAGIGKTALLSGFIESHRRSCRVLWGACDPFFTPRPLGPLYDMALRSLPGLLDLLNSGANWLTIATALLKALQEQTLPVIVVFEDIHWADGATLDLLKYLGRRIQQTHALVLLTYREDELHHLHPLRSVLGDFPSRETRRVLLPPLSEKAVEALAHKAGRPAAGIFAVTRGNPFFVTEVLRNADERVPATVRDAVLTRMARLAPASHAVLELASIIPGPIELWLLENIVHPEPSATDACLEGGFLLLSGSALLFRHELARLAIEDSLAPEQKKTYHRSVLKELIRRAASETPLAQLVHHATQAADGEAVIKFAPLAAQQASQHGAHHEAARHYRTALLYHRLLLPVDHADLLDRLSFEGYLTGQMEQATQIRKEGLSIWRKLDQPKRIGDSLRWLSRLNWFQGNKIEAERFADEAVDFLEKYPPELELAMAYSNRSQLFMLAEDAEPAIRWGEKALALAERMDATELKIHALTNIGTAELLRGDEAGRQKLEQSLRMALGLEMHDHVARCYACLSTATAKLREYHVAGPYLEDGIRYTTDRDLDSYSIYLRGWRARWHFEQGHWEEAAQDAQEALRLTTGAAVMTLPAVILLGHLRARQGNAAATGLLERAQTLALPTGEAQRIGPMASARAEAAWWAGDARRTITEAVAGYDLAIQAHDDWLLGTLTYWIWRAGGNPNLSVSIPMAYRLMIEGNWQASAAEWERIGCPFERALALSAGDRQARLEALAIFEQLGAPPAARALREELRQQGEKGIPRGPRPTTRKNAQGLTAREMDVLYLLSEGLGNADIARRLSITPKTVDHHVSAILSKFDVHSRSEAVAIARNQHILP